ncbi:MAG: hypothetical protein AAF600_10090 [Bacteroidota bacterium]
MYRKNLTSQYDWFSITQKTLSGKILTHYENKNVNLLTPSNLGLVSMNDRPPVVSTYYLFRKQVADYVKLIDENLFDQVFTKLNKTHSPDFEGSGKHIRMKSKLLSSNIVWLSLYEWVHQSLKQCYQPCKEAIKGVVNEALKTALVQLVGEKAEKVLYRLGYQTSKKVLHKRNNVEATIFQLSYHCSGGPTRYRGLVKHQMRADIQCLWINFVRIKSYLVNKDGESAGNSVKKAVKRACYLLLDASLSFGEGVQSIFGCTRVKNHNLVIC